MLPTNSHEPLTPNRSALNLNAAPLRPTIITISTEAIALRAYEKYLGRSCTHGSDQTDWLNAEQELKIELLQD